MAISQEQVDAWFAANPNATADDIAAAVQSIGGLSANEGLASMIANRYAIAEPEVTNYYNAYTAPKAETPAEAIARIAREQAEAKRIADANLAALQTTGTTSGITSTPVNDSGLGKNTQTFTDSIVNTPTSTTDFLSTIADTTANNTAVTGGTGATAVTGATGTDTSQADLLAALAAPADNITSTGGVTKSAVQPTSGGVSNVIEGDDIETQIAQLPQEYASWQSSSIPGYIDFIRKSDGAVLDRRQNHTLSDLDLAKIGLSFIPGAGQILAGINIADAARRGNLLQAAIGVTGLVPGMQNVGTALKVGQAIDQNNPFGAITALAGNTDLQSALGLNNATVGGFTAKDAMAAGNLVQAATTGNYGGVISNLGTLTGSSDTVLAGRALSILTRFQNGDTKALGDAIALSTGISNGTTKTTGTTGSTTVGDFEDTEVTRLKGLGYTKEQIQDYFRNLDNLTSNLDTAASTVVGATGNDVTLPTGVQLASTGDGVFRTDVGGVPTYAESANASSVTAPLGYKLLSTSESENKPAGSYYDITANAWFKPETAVTDLTGSDTIQADAALFNNSLGTLDQLDSNRTADDFADFLRTIGITNVTQLTDSGLSNQDILDMINALDDTVTVTGATGNDTLTGATTNDTITGANGNDNLQTVTVTGAKGNDTVTGIDTITGANGNDLVVDDKGNVTIVGKKEFCPTGQVLNPETGECEIPQTKETITCPTGFHLGPDGKTCVADTKETLSCPTGFQPNEAGTECIPVVEIVDKKCDVGFVYDEDLKMCVPITVDESCPIGFHKDESGKCVPDTKEALKCPEGYAPNEAGTECIPIVEIVDKKCPPGQVYDEELKKCVLVTEQPITCPTGFHLGPDGKTCVADEEKLVCAKGFELNESGTACIPVVEIKACPEGQHRDETGKCVPDDIECGAGYHLENGACVKDALVCSEGFQLNDAGTECIPVVKVEACKTGFHRDETGVCVPDEIECGVGYHLENGVCVVDKLVCSKGFELNEAGTECIPIIEIKACPTGQHRDETGKCVPDTEDCADGYHLENGMCVADEDCEDGYHRENGVCVPNECPEGYLRNLETGLCEKVEEKSCPPGQTKNAQGVCVPIVQTPKPPIVCPTGFKLVNGACVPIPKTTAMPTMGASGEGEKTDPIYAGGMDDFNLLATLQELLASEAPKKDDKKSKDKTKMASGGHLDDLLAEQMTVDDLLKLLR